MASPKRVWHARLLNLQATNYKAIYKLKLVVETGDLPVNTLLNMFECVRVCIYIYISRICMPARAFELTTSQIIPIKIQRSQTD